MQFILFFLLVPTPVVALPLSSPIAPDDEPDSLSWEIYSQDRDIILHYLDWAATNPPPGSAGILPAAPPPGSAGILPAAVAQERDPPAGLTNHWPLITGMPCPS